MTRLTLALHQAEYWVRQAHYKYNAALDYFTNHGRGQEWVTCFIKLHLAYILIQPGETLSLKTYANIKDVGFLDWSVAVILVLASANHMFALFRNGSWKRSPLWRGMCCFAGMVIFGVMWFLTQTSPMVTPTMSPAFLFGLVLFELIACRRAGVDYRCLKQR